MWQPIETAPKDNRERLNYIIITDRVCMPDIAIWQNELPERTDRYGTHHAARPAGWFNVTRSRIANPTHWMPLPEQPL